jgi:hypothetical protein
MGRIGLHTFKQTVGGVDDDAKVRLGSTDRQPKTAQRGFLGRAVRWLFGATKQDRADNKKIMGDLLKGLQAKYGTEVGARAFLAARHEAYVSKGDMAADGAPGAHRHRRGQGIATPLCARRRQVRPGDETSQHARRPAEPGAGAVLQVSTAGACRLQA